VGVAVTNANINLSIKQHVANKMWKIWQRSRNTEQTYNKLTVQRLKE